MHAFNVNALQPAIGTRYGNKQCCEQQFASMRSPNVCPAQIYWPAIFTSHIFHFTWEHCYSSIPSTNFTDPIPQPPAKLLASYVSIVPHLYTHSLPPLFPSIQYRNRFALLPPSLTQLKWVSTMQQTHHLECILNPSLQNSKQIALVSAGIVGATSIAYMVANNTVSANMADEGLHPPAYPWYQNSPLHTFDHAAYVTGSTNGMRKVRSHN